MNVPLQVIGFKDLALTEDRYNALVHHMTHIDLIKKVPTLFRVCRYIIVTIGGTMKKYTYVPGSFIAAWLIWELIVRLGGFNEALLPTPYKVLVGFGELIGDGVLFKDIADSLVRFFIGYLISVVAGVFFGLILGWYKGDLELHQSNRSSHSTNFSCGVVALYRSLLRYRSSASYRYHLYRSILPGAIVHRICYSKY